MGSYRVVWRVLVGLLAGLGCVIAIFGTSAATIVWTATAATMISSTITIWRHYGERHLLRDVMLRSAIAASCAVGSIGLLRVVGGIGVLLVAALAATSPWLVGRLRQRVRLGRAETPLLDPERLPDGAVSELSDRQLCWAWTHSHDRFRTSVRPMERVELACQRQAYLDELERRHPAEFACWLYNHPDPGDDPGPFLVTGH